MTLAEETGQQILLLPLYLWYVSMGELGQKSSNLFPLVPLDLVFWFWEADGQISQFLCGVPRANIARSQLPLTRKWEESY